MLRASVDTVANVTGGELICGNAEALVTGVAIDSRDCGPRCVFIALAGERTDGHEYLEEALRAGARLLVVTRDPASLTPLLSSALSRGASVIRVPDGVRALQELAAWHRSRLLSPVVGITGSTGKTTTKDLLRAMLATSMRVTSTEGNRNNEIGVPLTVLGAGTHTAVLVVELGMRGLGQIARLCEIARPDLGLVTNVGTSHIELLGSQDAIAAAKAELLDAVPPEGAVFLNGDDANSMAIAGRAVAPVTRYGLDESCDVRATDIVLDEMSRPSFTMHTLQGPVELFCPIPGRHNVYNALAAAAVAIRLAVPLDRIAEGLASARLSGMRMESVTTAAGVTVINDAYNASPASMRAAIDTLASTVTVGRRIAVLGDMAELGGLTELAHFEIGEHVARIGLDGLVTVGLRAARIADGARAEGMDPESVRPCATVEEASEVLDDLVERGDTVLVKASRVMGLEAVVERLVNPRVG